MLLPLILLLGTTVSAYSDFALINASKGFSLNGDGMEARGIQSSFNGKHLHVLPSNVRRKIFLFLKMMLNRKNQLLFFKLQI